MLLITRRTALAGPVALAATPVMAMTPTPGFASAAAYSAERRGVSLLVMQAGRVLFEDYPRSTAGTAHELASGTKSFSGVLAAAMVQDGLLSLHEPCSNTLVEWRNDPIQRRATIRSLLSLTSGVGGGTMGRPPTYAAAVAQPFAGLSGVFRYGPTPFQVFGEILRRKLQAVGHPDDVLAVMADRVLRPAGVSYQSWRRQEGQPNLPSGARLTAANWARFGTFVMGGCRVEGRTIVDADTLAACFEPSAANPGYGMSWWLLRPGLVPPGPRSGIDADPGKLSRLPDIRMAAGAGNQRLYLIPERDMVVVRQADGNLNAMRGVRSGWSDPDFLTRLFS